MMSAASGIAGLEARAKTARLRALGSACLAHILHDGYTDLLYLMLPIWQREFGLSLALVGLMKTLFSGALSLFQIPLAKLASRVGERAVLAGGTLLIATAVLGYGFAGSTFILYGLLLIGGLGAAAQHPLSSSIVARSFEGPKARAVLGTYNFAGDLGKVLLPSAAAFLIWFADWRTATSILGLAGIALGLVLLWMIPAPGSEKPAAPTTKAQGASVGNIEDRGLAPGFVSLTAIGIFDNATRTAFLTFLPILMSQKGASPAAIGTALSLIFAGGAFGKFACGLVAGRFGVIRTVVLTEALTAILIAVLFLLPLAYGYILLLPLGVALNGTSSVLYGSVAELAPQSRRAHAFAVFYTASLGAGALAPSIFGVIGDRIGLPMSILCVAGMALLTLPFSWQLARTMHLKRSSAISAGDLDGIE